MANNLITTQPQSNHIRVVEQGTFTLGDLSLIVSLLLAVLTLYNMIQQSRQKNTPTQEVKVGVHATPCSAIGELSEEVTKTLVRLESDNLFLKGKNAELEVRVRRLEICAAKLGCTVEASLNG